ncbi:MAG: hypothetical protein QW292_04375 [Candidatus Parvarchaeota archaeon]
MRVISHKRRGISLTTATYGAIIIIIILGIASFFLVASGTVTIPGVSPPISTTPAAVSIITTNSTLAPYIYPGGGLVDVPALVVQPNVVYKFNVTVVFLNANGQVIKTPIYAGPDIGNGGGLDFGTTEYINGISNPYGANINLTPSYGALPFNAVLSIELPPNSNATIIFSDTNTTTNIPGSVWIPIKSAY